MSATDELLRNAETYAARFDKGDLPIPPARKLAVLACMDARLNPYALLGLREGDAHIIRNAGGVVTDDEIRSLAISQRLLGTEEIILIHHTDCGMLTFTDDEFKRSVPGRRRDQARVGRRGLLRPRRGRAPVDRPHPGEPVHPAQGLRARLRLRGRERAPARGDLSRRARERRDNAAVPAPSDPDRWTAVDRYLIRGGSVLDGDDASAVGVRRFFDLIAAEPRLRATAIQTVGEKGYDGFALAVVL